MQAQWRSHWQRQTYLRQKSASTCVQATVRCWRAQRAYARLRRAAIIVQVILRRCPTESDLHSNQLACHFLLAWEDIALGILLTISQPFERSQLLSLGDCFLHDDCRLSGGAGRQGSWQGRTQLRGPSKPSGEATVAELPLQPSKQLQCRSREFGRAAANDRRTAGHWTASYRSGCVKTANPFG